MNALTYAKLQLRLNRTFVISWLMPLLSIPIIFGPSYRAYYPTLEDRTALVTGMKSNLGIRAMYGAIGEPGTLGQLVAWEGAGWLMTLSAVMTVLLLFRAYRRPEASSLGELPRATGLRPVDVALGSLLLVAGTCLVLGTGLTLELLALNQVYHEFPVMGGVLYGGAVGVAALAAALVAALLSLASNDSSSPSRLGLLSIGVAFLVRAVADIKDQDAIAWLSTLGWFRVVGPYNGNHAGHLVIQALVTVALAATWITLERQRECNTGLTPVRTATAPRQRKISSPWRLRLILDRGFVGTWLITIAVLSAFMASLSSSMDELLSQDEKTGQIFKQMFTEQDMQTAFLTYLADFLGILMVVAVVTLITRQRKEEVEGTVDLMRATGIPRQNPMALLVGNASCATALFALAAALGAYGGVKGNPDTGMVALTANLSQVAPMLCLAGLAALLTGWHARWALLAWVPVIYSGTLTILGPLLTAPDWLLQTSAFGHAINSANTDHLGGWLILVAIGAVAMFGGVVLAGRREVL